MQAGPEPDDPRPIAIRSLDGEALLGQAPHAMLVLDLEGRIREANARAEALLDQNADSLRGARFGHRLDDSSRSLFEHAFETACRPGEAPPDVELVLAQGHAFVDATFLPVHDGERVVLLLLRDRSREQARHARSDAQRREDAETSKAEILANRKMADLGKLIAGVTHELRTPLTYVANHLMIQRARLDDLAKREPSIHEQLADVLASNATAQQGVDRVIRVVQELRPLSKNRPHRPQPIDLAELVLDAVRTFRSADAGRTRVSLDLQSTHRLPLDRDDMGNVLLNLLNNAADAVGRHGTIEIVTRNAAVPPEIRVIDHGPGVPPEMAAHLFEPFCTSKPDGTGLGLFISRRTVEAHGGTLTHEPTPGGGATFVVRLPMPEGE